MLKMSVVSTSLAMLRTSIFNETLNLKRRLLLPHSVAQASTHSSQKPPLTYVDPSGFKPRNALILSKISRYEFEKNRNPNLTEDDLERKLSKRGSDLSLMRRHYHIHKSVEKRLEKALQSQGMKTQVCQRPDYTDEKIKWADIVFTAGGDGTFLMAASKILNPSKPLVGLNSDPRRSEGYLCLPKYYSENVEEAIEKIAQGSFYWYLRKRLRITLIGDRKNIREAALELHQQELKYPEYRYVELINEANQPGDHPLGSGSHSQNTEDKLSRRIIPILALNEVYIGESLSSRVSYLEVRFDDEEDAIKTRNSGLCVSTGTGSTSWTFNINKLTSQSVEALLRIVFETPHFPVNWKDQRLVRAVTQKFNNEIVFDPEENLMTYTLRDPVSSGTFPGPFERRPRGKAERIKVKSRCFDASLVIDGSLSFKFNDGTQAIIEIYDDDALRTLNLYSNLESNANEGER